MSDPGWQWKLEPRQAVLLPFLLLFCRCGLLVCFLFFLFLTISYGMCS